MMAAKIAGLPPGYTIDLDAAPEPELRAALAREINGFHARTIPHDSKRFALLLRGPEGEVTGGVMGSTSWSWLFIEAMWVGDDLRGHGIGRALMTAAEAHATAHGCHSAWLDTFQAKPFYLALGYEPFGVLDNYPGGQSRTFMKKHLGPTTIEHPTTPTPSGSVPPPRR